MTAGNIAQPREAPLRPLAPPRVPPAPPAPPEPHVRQDLIRVLIVDESPVVRLGLRSVLGEAGRCFIVGEAGTAAEAIDEARHRRPDVILMDIHLPGGDGPELCRSLREEFPAAQVVVFTTSVVESELLAAIVAGAVGYVLKDAAPERVVEAVERAAAGESLLDPASAREMMDWVRRYAAGPRQDDPLAALSPQERKILPLIARGMTNREIGEALILSDQTIKGYVSALLKKLRLSRRAEVAAFGARHLPHVAVPLVGEEARVA